MKGWGWIASALFLAAIDVNDGLQWWPLILVLTFIGGFLISSETRRRLRAIDEASEEVRRGHDV